MDLHRIASRVALLFGPTAPQEGAQDAWLEYVTSDMQTQKIAEEIDHLEGYGGISDETYEKIAELETKYKEETSKDNELLKKAAKLGHPYAIELQKRLRSMGRL
jgi:5'-deoxynucleotidase YfbR-like HD superfamily hydrolase